MLTMIIVIIVIIIIIININVIGPPSEDYIAACRACTFGHGQKTNFANPYKA